MTSIKMIIFLGLFAMALSVAIPNHQFDDPANAIYADQTFADEAPLSEGEVLARQVRSPDNEPKRTVEARGEHHSRHGSSASVDYTHPLNKNVDVYGGVSRNFKYNDNSGHVGVRYKF